MCVDVGAFRDAINAYHRLMDLRDKYCDVQVSRKVASLVVQNDSSNVNLRMAGLCFIP